ncbi:hypothetical protein [Clostridium estertheticum]|uniref:hypothetical protein n=1 Tax=Clostridium estertheticum TaxID=238834 RepID=UPI001C0E02CE|nr:hypothetical protein [Clostridium estertheticum]MBU3186554.1 hypothetical protein [Clostridium estertheticum]
MGIQCRCNQDTGTIGGWSVKFIKSCRSLKTGDRYGCIKVEEIEEQSKDITEEDVVVEKEFEVGDKVRVINKLESLKEVDEVDIGDTAIIEKNRTTNSYKLRMDKDKDYWFARVGEIELIKSKDIQRLKIITEGTTTTVKIKGSNEGVAKLYHGEEYNRGYGITVALGRALGIDLIAEVLKVTSSYEVKPTKEEIKEFPDKTVFKPRKFKIGDIVKGIDRHYYPITSTDMSKAEVISYAEDENIKIKILEHVDEFWIDAEYEVKPEYFDLVTSEVPKPKISIAFKIGDIVKGIDKDYYGITNTEMTKAEVVNVIDNDNIKIKVLEHNNTHWIGCELRVTPKYFKLVEAPSIKKPVLSVDDFKIGDKVVPHSKTTEGYEGDFRQEYSWREAKRIGQPYLYVAAKYKTPEGENILELNSDKGRKGGNYYLPTDVTFYTEVKEAKHEKEDYLCGSSKSSVKKLYLIDDKLKVGDEVTKIQAIKIIRDGGKIKNSFGSVYYEENGILKYKNRQGDTHRSSGYESNLGSKLVIA